MIFFFCFLLSLLTEPQLQFSAAAVWSFLLNLVVHTKGLCCNLCDICSINPSPPSELVTLVKSHPICSFAAFLLHPSHFECQPMSDGPNKRFMRQTGYTFHNSRTEKVFDVFSFNSHASGTILENLIFLCENRLNLRGRNRKRYCLLKISLGRSNSRRTLEPVVQTNTQLVID